MSKDNIIYLSITLVLAVLMIVWGWHDIKNKKKYSNPELNDADYTLSMGLIILGIISVIGIALFIIINYGR